MRWAEDTDLKRSFLVNDMVSMLCSMLISNGKVSEDLHKPARHSGIKHSAGKAALWLDVRSRGGSSEPP